MTRPRHSALRASGIHVGYGDRAVLAGVDLSIEAGKVTAIIGPNGCGKSTLLRTLGRLLRPSRGAVLIDARPIDELRTRDVARHLALLPQAPVAPEGMTVHELVSRGRHPHQGLFRQWSEDDDTKVTAALALTGLAELSTRSLETLSGGQRQRAWLALTLAQDTPILLLDEPTTYLDISHSLEVLDLVDRLHSDLGRTVVMVLHDLNLAARYADELVVMHDGAIAAQGSPSEIVTEELLFDVFGLNARVIVDPVSETPLIVPIGQRHTRVTAPPTQVRYQKST